MDPLSQLDWTAMFVPTNGILDILIRGTAMSLLLCLRSFGSGRSGSSVSPALLIIVLIANAARNAMAKGYRSIAQGLILVRTIIFWNIAFDWLGYRFPALQRFTRSSPLCRIRNRRVLRRNLDRST